ncbi:MAG: metallophosphoesterase [Candidatus Korarchaeota archaeon]
MRIAHISDTHIGNDTFFFSKKATKRGLKLINEAKPDIVIHTGDITGHGLLEEYEMAKKLFRFKCPFLAVPGNHDSENVGYELFFKFYGHRGFAEEFEKNGEKFYIVGVDTTIPDSPDGRVGEGGLEFIRESFENAPKNGVRILTMHHHIIPTFHSGREFCTVSDGGDLLQLIIDMDINVVLSGHRHSFTVRSVKINGKKTVVINAGSLSQITRGFEGHSFNIVDISKNKVNISCVPVDDPPRPSSLPLKQEHAIGNEPQLVDLGRKVATIVHIGDTHFGQNSYVEKMFTRAVEVVKETKPDLVIVTGDITHDGSIESLELGKEKLSLIDAPMIVIAGDRDFRPLTVSAYHKIFGTFPKFYESEKLAAVALNSCLFEEKLGYIRRSRFAKAIEWLSERKDKLRILIFHHPLLPIPGAKYSGMLLNAGDILTGITSAKIDLVAFSYGHVGFGVQVDGSIISNAGNTCSKLLQEKIEYSLNLIEIYEKAITLREKSLMDEREKVFGPFQRPA